VAVYLSVPRAFGVIEESNPLVSLELAHDLAGDFRDAVADDEQLYLLDGLRESAPGGVKEQRPVVVGRDDYGSF
jgi:hypothetical protein